MCDPISMLIGGVVGGGLLKAAQPSALAAVAQPDPAAERAAAEASAANAANQKTAADKRSRQANVLALGGNSDQLGGSPLGGAAPVLSMGATPAQRSAAAGTTGSNTVLGGGAGSGGTGRVGFQPVKRVNAL